jgi:hypothetical protein
MMMSRTSPSLRHRPALLLLVGVLAAAGATVAAPPALANKPVFTAIDPTPATFPVNALCGFPMELTGTQTGTIRTFTDANGNVVRLSAHVTETDILVANGVTLVGRPYTFDAEVRLDPAGNIVSAFGTGVVADFPLPSGGEYFAAGWVDELAHPNQFIVNPDRGKVGDVAALCAALSG